MKSKRSTPALTSVVNFNFCPKSKLSQVKIQQTAFMLIAVTLFFILIGLFVLGIVYSGIKKTAENLDEKNVMLLVSKLASSPEFSCGGAFNSGEINCIDADKAMVLKDKKEYNGFWGVSAIEIRKIYPVNEGQECSIENYPECDLIKIYSGETGQGNYISNFVSLCRKEKIEETERVYDKCELAKLLVAYGGGE